MTRAANPSDDSFIKDLPRQPASDLKTAGWPETVRTVLNTGKLLITNHNRPEAVILSVGEYEGLMRLARQGEALIDVALVELRREYDERLSVLHGSKAANRLRANMRRATKLAGKVRAGQTY